jgi:archaellum component FlaC
MAEVTKEVLRDRLGNIDQIRDILMGPQLRDYETRLAQVEADLSLLRQDLRDRIEETKTSFASEIRATVESLDKRIKAVSLTASEESADLRQLSDRMNKKFSNTIEALNDSVDKQVVTLRDELSETKARLQEDVRTLRDQIFEELDRQFSSLRTGKVSKDDMAEILFEVAMRIKGTEFVRQLKEATDTEVYGGIAILEDEDNP